MNLVFAVTDEQKNIYHKLIPLIAGSEIGVLDSDSQNIVKLVRDNYLVNEFKSGSFGLKSIIIVKRICAKN